MYLQNELSNIVVSLRIVLSLHDRYDFPSLRDAAEQLARLTPYTRTRQARPATPAHVWTLEREEPAGRGLLARILFHSAARYSDWVARLPARCVSLPTLGWVRVRYLLTKSAQKGAVRTCVFRLPITSWMSLRSRLATLTPGRALFDYHPDRYRAWLRRFRMGLSLRSFRRGAVQLMLDHGVSLREIRRLTGHKSDQTLLIYADREPISAWRAMRSVYPALLGVLQPSPVPS